MKKILSIALVVFLALCAAAYLAFAQGEKKMEQKEMKEHKEHKEMKAEPKTGTVEGELVDLKCLLGMDMRGEGHKKCAVACCKDGAPSGVVDKAGEAYVILFSSSKIADHAGKQVRLTGKLFDKPKSILPDKMEVMQDGKWTAVELGQGM